MVQGWDSPSFCFQFIFLLLLQFWYELLLLVVFAPSLQQQVSFVPDLLLVASSLFPLSLFIDTSNHITRFLLFSNNKLITTLIAAIVIFLYFLSIDAAVSLCHRHLRPADLRRPGLYFQPSQGPSEEPLCWGQCRASGYARDGARRSGVVAEGLVDQAPCSLLLAWTSCWRTPCRMSSFT